MAGNRYMVLLLPKAGQSYPVKLSPSGLTGQAQCPTAAGAGAPASATVTKLASRRAPASELFSGWNCTPHTGCPGTRTAEGNVTEWVVRPMVAALSGEAHDAGNEPQARGQGPRLRRVLGAVLEHEVHTQADTEKRRAGRHGIGHSRAQAELFQRRGGIGEGAHAGQHHGVGRAHPGRIVGDDDFGPRAAQPPLHREQVSLMVINDNDQLRNSPHRYGQQRRAVHDARPATARPLWTAPRRPGPHRWPRPRAGRGRRP